MLFKSSHMALAAVLLASAVSAAPLETSTIAVAGDPVMIEPEEGFDAEEAFDADEASSLEKRVSSTYINNILYYHNVHRANHSAPALTWGSAMAQNAKVWAQKCNFSHNTTNVVGKAQYGQNLLVGFPKAQIGPGVSDYWYNQEEPYFHWYGQANPDFNSFENYGHFSQMVWKNSKTVGCFTADCSATGVKGIDKNSGIPPLMTVCNYFPPGKFIRSFSLVLCIR